GRARVTVDPVRPLAVRGDVRAAAVTQLHRAAASVPAQRAHLLDHGFHPSTSASTSSTSSRIADGTYGSTLPAARAAPAASTWFIVALPAETTHGPPSRRTACRLPASVRNRTISACCPP